MDDRKFAIAVGHSEAISMSVWVENFNVREESNFTVGNWLSI
jgi:hypothetical protein